jgi:ER lumen protein retaining receptor
MDYTFWTFEGGYFFQHAAIVFQIIKISERRNTECVSLETNILFLIGAITRIIWVSGKNGIEKYISFIEKLIAVTTLSYIIYMYQKYKSKNFYSTQIKLPFYLRLYFLVPVIIILSLCFNPGDKFFTDQIFVSLGIFCESVGLLPQIYILEKSKERGDISKLYLMFLAIARLLRLSFWIIMYLLGGRFFSLITADVIYCLALSNVIYDALKNCSGKGLPIDLSKLKKSNQKNFY